MKRRPKKPDLMLCPPGLHVSKDAYALIVQGTELAPMVRDGDTVICDPGAPRPVPGQLAVFYFQPLPGESASDEDGRPIMKRMVTDLSATASLWPHNPASEVDLLIEVEQLLPPIRRHLLGMRVRAIHPVVHVVRGKGSTDKLTPREHAQWKRLARSDFGAFFDKWAAKYGTKVKGRKLAAARRQFVDRAVAYVSSPAA